MAELDLIHGLLSKFGDASDSIFLTEFGAPLFAEGADQGSNARHNNASIFWATARLHNRWTWLSIFIPSSL